MANAALAFCLFGFIGSSSIGAETTALRSKSVVVKTENGPVEGHLILLNDSVGTAFLGIPFAEPPTGKLRFRNPIPAKPWNGTLKCDRMFPPDVIIQNFASKGIVFVTVGYRLSILGFLATGGAEASGNYGMQDIVEGLRWVQREIKNFGGDAKRVTLMGHSTGATAVSLLTLSPVTAGLFQQAIVMSGTAFSPGELQNNSAPYMKWIKRVGCLKVGFRTRPTVDGLGGLFPASVKQLAAQRRPIPYMIGTTSKEFSANYSSTLKNSNFSTKSLCKTAMQLAGVKQRFFNVIRCVINYFCKPSFRSKLNQSALIEHQAVKLLSDVTLYVPVYEDASNMKSRKANVYLYSFDYAKKGLEAEAPWHSMDLTYVLGIHPFNFTQQDLQIQETYLNLIRNFTIFGDPTPMATGKQKWIPLKTSQASNYFSINVTSEQRSAFRHESLHFWQELADDEDPESQEDEDYEDERLEGYYSPKNLVKYVDVIYET
ncbi:unnamed protein product [Soboliphyme baturini]|uniref:Carboxylic ester hydrolase n=1 Tax=Soboliphyme baturini TaxID=241478 RepID=A0A183IN32_9BILA|nr:unnamed protein product [Soboliphyme baturini]